VLRRILLTLILLPISIIVLMLAVANRQSVALVLDPFAGEAGPSVAVPLFVVVFVTLILGVVLGGVTVWLAQGRYRKAARHARREARYAHEEADKLRTVVARTQPQRTNGLPLPSGGSAPALTDRRNAA